MLNIKIDLAKLLYGPIGAACSIGGILGGILTSNLTKVWSPETALNLSVWFDCARQFKSLCYEFRAAHIFAKKKAKAKNTG